MTDMDAPTLRFPPRPPSPSPPYAAIAAAPRHRGPVATALADVVGVFRLAGRVLLQHWPTLLALALIGVILRSGAIIGAAYVEFGHGNLSWFVFALAPLAYLVPLILMLRRAQRSLPELSRYHRVLTDAAPVLLAFVLFYGSAGMLSDDLETFRVDIPLIGIGNFFSTNSRGQNVAEQTLDPLPHPPLIWAPVLIGVLALIRWALRRVRVLRRHAALGAPAAYVEILWLLFAVTGIAQLWSDYALPWLQARRAWASTVDWLHSDFHAAGVLAAPLRAAVGLWLAAWSALNTAILVPVTAVLTAAVLYGIQTERRAAPNRPARGGGLAAFGRALVRIPRDAVMSRVGPVLSGLRVMVRVGLVAMAVFALFYAVLTVLPGFLILAERHLVGAQDLSDVWIPLNRVTVRLNAVITTVLLVALLAGVMGQVARRLDQSGSTGEQPDVVRQ